MSGGIASVRFKGDKIRLLFLSMFLLLSHFSIAGNAYEVVFPDIMVGGVPTMVRIKALRPIPDTVVIPAFCQQKPVSLTFFEQKAEISMVPVDGKSLNITIEGRSFVSSASAIPLWYSVIPPLIAILFALLFREVFTALMLGLFSGTAAIAWFGGSGMLASLGIGLLRIVDTYIIETITSHDHVSIIVFSFLIGGMVHIITANGGMKGVVNSISRYALSRRSALFSTWLLGIMIFFDDYANTLVVGNAMRPLTDKMRISREKLSYIVDSTAAPVAAIAFITTWIGAELSYIKNATDVINASAAVPLNENPYTVFFCSLPYSFYPFLALFFVFMIVITGRDFGPMRKAEAHAACHGFDLDNSLEDVSESLHRETKLESNVSPKPFNAIIPVIIVVLGTCLGLYFTGLQVVGWDVHKGFGGNVSNIIGNADTFRALLWSSFSGVMVAILLSVSQRILSLEKSVSSMISGFKTMLAAMMILVLAWSLAALTVNLHTADFLSQSMLSLDVTPRWIPSITFVLAALVAFSTGSSWGTMAILFPLVLPAGWNLFIHAGLASQQSLVLFHAIVASVLAGAVFGDHCSPISDTTILSSLATRCNHIDHVRTQLPYALLVGVVSVIGGIIPVSFGLSPWVALVLSALLLFLFVRLLGKRIVDKQ